MLRLIGKHASFAKGSQLNVRIVFGPKGEWPLLYSGGSFARATHARQCAPASIVSVSVRFAAGFELETPSGQAADEQSQHVTDIRVATRARLRDALTNASRFLSWRCRDTCLRGRRCLKGVDDPGGAIVDRVQQGAAAAIDRRFDVGTRHDVHFEGRRTAAQRPQPAPQPRSARIVIGAFGGHWRCVRHDGQARVRRVRLRAHGSRGAFPRHR